jgi:hypothetical protein
LNRPNPTIAEIKDAVHKFCELPWEHLSSSYAENKHPYTGSNQLSQRCIESLYIVTLLEHGFGLDADYRGVTIALQVFDKL